LLLENHDASIPSIAVLFLGCKNGSKFQPWSQRGAKSLHLLQNGYRLSAMLPLVHVFDLHSSIRESILPNFFSYLNRRELCDGHVHMKSLASYSPINREFYLAKGTEKFLLGRYLLSGILLMLLSLRPWGVAARPAILENRGAKSHFCDYFIIRARYLYLSYYRSMQFSTFFVVYVFLSDQ
jgi:hypothetical protein